MADEEDAGSLRAKVRVISGATFVVTIVLLADPLRLFSRPPSETLVGLLIGAMLLLFGIEGVERIIRNGRS